MHDRVTIRKLVVGELPELKGQARDPRIDACRGIALPIAEVAAKPDDFASRLSHPDER